MMINWRRLLIFARNEHNTDVNNSYLWFFKHLSLEIKPPDVHLSLIIQFTISFYHIKLGWEKVDFFSKVLQGVGKVRHLIGCIENFIYFLHRVKSFSVVRLNLTNTSGCWYRIMPSLQQIAIPTKCGAHRSVTNWRHFNVRVKSAPEQEIENAMTTSLFKIKPILHKSKKNCSFSDGLLYLDCIY